MKLRVIWRIDDLAPGFPWDAFDPIAEKLIESEITPIIGVIPSNLDNSLGYSSDNPKDFWDKVRNFQDLGWVIAQHGLHHICSGNHRNYLGSVSPSEFCGLSLWEQEDKIAKGKDLLFSQGIDTKVFMAPKHSFDMLTISALNSLDFSAITDGWGVRPYLKNRIALIPQLTSRFFTHVPGIWTNCIHIKNTNPYMQKFLIKQINEFKRFAITPAEAIAEASTPFLAKTTKFLLSEVRPVLQKRKKYF